MTIRRKIFAVVYRDPDPGAPTFTWYTRAFDAEGALLRWNETAEDEGWSDALIESVREVTR